MKRTVDLDIWRFRSKIGALDACFRAWLSKHPEVTHKQLKDIYDDLGKIMAFINDHFRDTVPKKENADEETK